MKFPPHIIKLLRSSQAITCLTGAGLSVASGLPTFRDPLKGLWAQYNIEELATPDAFADDPGTVWNWYESRRQQAMAAKPNAGHRAIADMAMYVPSVRVITQNVDGLHQQAGTTDAIEMHGSLFTARCMGVGHTTRKWVVNGHTVPTCAECGHILRPGVVWFGEAIPLATIKACYEALYASRVFMVIGTSGLVAPASTFATIVADYGGAVIVVNPEPQQLAQGVHQLCIEAVELADLVEEVWG